MFILAQTIKCTEEQNYTKDSKPNLEKIKGDTYTYQGKLVKHALRDGILIPKKLYKLEIIMNRYKNELENLYHCERLYFFTSDYGVIEYIDRWIRIKNFNKAKNFKKISK